MSQDFDPFVAELITYVTNPRYTLVEKCLKMAQIFEYSDLSIVEYVSKLNNMGKVLRDSISDVKNPTYLISMLNEYMFDTLGFTGNHDDYFNPKNNFLNVVMDTKVGIPITLSIIYVEIAKHIGLDLRPVGFPSHFLVKQSEEIILDPYGRGRLLTIDDLNEILERSYGGEVEFMPQFLDEIEPEKIIIRIARNLKNSYTQSFNYDMAMHCINLILGIEPTAPEEIRDRGILEARLLHYDLALESLNKYLELMPEAEDVDYVLDLIRGIRERANQ
ncbi:MAG TPA: transglutaminase-like domain-containing protein [Nitrosopumilaceae archaeon]|nr:transglutaminase-like domain-containing protein [Nitrosopumilaceae archaeon]